MEAGSISALPPHVHDDRIVTQSATGSVNQVCTNRLVSHSFCKPASHLVCTLETGPACDITSKAWSSFCRVKALRINLFKGQPQQPQQPHGAATPTLIRNMLERAPKGRLQRFALVAEVPSEQEHHRQATPGTTQAWVWPDMHVPPDAEEQVRMNMQRDVSWACHTAAALSLSASSRALEHVSIAVAMPASAADMILSSLPQLQGLDVTIAIPHRTAVPAPKRRSWWAPAGGEQLRSLRVRVLPLTSKCWPQQELNDNEPSSNDSSEEEGEREDEPCLVIDASALARSTQLEVLHLGSCGHGTLGVNLVKFTALAALQQLRELVWYSGFSEDPSAAELRALLQLKHLHTLRTGLAVQPRQWEVLARLPGLQRLRVSSLILVPDSSPSASITDMHIHCDLHLRAHLDAVVDDEPLRCEEVPCGLLARVLPAAELLRFDVELMTTLMDYARAMYGHSRLRNVSIFCPAFEGQPGWEAGPFEASLGMLQEVQLELRYLS